MSDHAAMSPSGRALRQACPASWKEQQKYPEPPSGPSAIDGTHTHRLLEVCLCDKATDAQVYVGKTLKDHEGEFVVDRARAERVNVALNYIQTVCAELFALDGVPPTVISETRVDPEYLIGRSDMSGTVDVQILSRTKWVLIDYKDGVQPVSAQNNPQLEQYAVGALAGLRIPVNQPYPVQNIDLVIVQPKLIDRGMSAVGVWSAPTSYFLDDVVARLAIEASKNDTATPEYKPGEHCRTKWCRANGKCSAQAVVGTAAIGISAVPTHTELVTLAEKNPNEMSDDDIRAILDATPMIRALLDGVAETALERAKSGRRIPGYKPVLGKGQRVWSKSDDEIADKLKGMGVPKDIIFKQSVISFPQLEKATWVKTKDGEAVTMRLSERQLKTLGGEFVRKTEGKMTMVPDTDPRPCAVNDVAQMFGPVSQTNAPSPVELPAWLM